jgi:hypothetical protein
MVLGIHFSFTVDLRLNILLFVEHLVGNLFEGLEEEIKMPRKKSGKKQHLGGLLTSVIAQIWLFGCSQIHGGLQKLNLFSF